MAEVDARQGWDSGVGATLRDHRLRRGIDLAAVAQTLNVRQPFLQAIEDGHYEDLPGPTYAAGFVRAYAEHLGLDADRAARQFKLETLGRTIGVDLHFPEPESERGIPKVAVLLASVLLLAVAYGAWYLLAPSGSDDALVSPVPERLAPTTAGEPASVALPLPADDAPPPPASEPFPPPGVDVSSQVTDPTGATSPEAGDGERVGEAPPALDQSAGAEEAANGPQGTVSGEDGLVVVDVEPGGAVTALTGEGQSGDARSGVLEPEDEPIVLRAVADSWIEVRDDAGRVVLEQVLRRGETVSLNADRGLFLATGNAGGLEVSLDGEALAPLGPSGAIRRAISLDRAALRPPAPPPASVEATDVVAASPIDSTAPADPQAAADGLESDIDVDERIVLRATANTWIEVRTPAGRVIVSRVLPAGESLGFDAARGLSLVTGNAGGLELRVDGEVLPPLGPSGAVRRGILLDPEALLAGVQR